MKVLIVDDVSINRDLLTDILDEAELESITACDGVECLEVLEAERGNIQAILLDLNMPRMNGLTTLRRIKQDPTLCDIPVIVISAQGEVRAETQSLMLGASDFIHKPFVPQVVLHRVRNACQLFLHQNYLEKLVERQTRELREQADRIQQTNERIIDILGTVVEYRDLESGEHIFRVRELTALLAQSMIALHPETGLTKEKADLIAAASPLHDLGKITISDTILLKPGKLTPREFELMKTHTTNGAQMLQHIEGVWDAEYTQLCCEICRHHHERYDGRGYPDGLKGDEIPLSAQLVSLADVYDALVSKRVYKSAYDPDTAFQMIVSGQCGVFDPKLIDCLHDAREGFARLAHHYTPPRVETGGDGASLERTELA
ncbi:MAG: response regulator [Eubacteriales bacterium]|nr:response regulator [Eubacteriales bacterium]